jgi:hypothetical protein
MRGKSTVLLDACEVDERINKSFVNYYLRISIIIGRETTDFIVGGAFNFNLRSSEPISSARSARRIRRGGHS